MKRFFKWLRLLFTKRPTNPLREYLRQFNDQRKFRDKRDEK
jgi:hypothetical protein